MAISLKQELEQLNDLTSQQATKLRSTGVDPTPMLPRKGSVKQIVGDHKPEQCFLWNGTRWVLWTSPPDPFRPSVTLR